MTTERPSTQSDSEDAAPPEADAAAEALMQLERQAALGMVTAGVAHEARNVMSGVLAFAQIGRQREDGTPRDRALFVEIEQSSKRCLDIMERVLDVVRSAPHPLTAARVEEVAVASVVETVVALTKAQARLGGIQLKADVPCKLPAAMGVETHFVQALLNLTINAIQATPENGTVEISAHETDERVVVVVSDTGSGVPEHERERVFQALYTTKGSAGTGLGLGLSRELIEAQGGTLTLEPTREQGGAVFCLRLPKAVDPTLGAG